MGAPAFRPGQVYRVDFEEGWHTYGRMLEDRPYFAFHDWRVQVPAADLLEVVKSPVLFVVAVRWHYHHQGRSWPSVGNVPLDVVDTPIPLQFILSPPDSTRPILADSKGGRWPATLEQCVGLEPVMVWDADHVEQRLADHYAGRPNHWVEMYRPKV